MPEIKPLRAWRYHSSVSSELDELTSPLFDVVSERQRKILYENPNNSVHLSVPKGDNKAESALKTFENWKSKQIIAQDKIPGIYVYYQKFSLPGSDRIYTRKGFVCMVRIHDWDENIILRHENTMPHSVNDREELLEKTQLNVSQGRKFTKF